MHSAQVLKMYSVQEMGLHPIVCKQLHNIIVSKRPKIVRMRRY